VDAWLNDDIVVKGYGRRSLRSLFAHVRTAEVGNGGAILYGGGALRRYGLGFSVDFFDRVGDKRLSIYVPSSEVQNYRHREFLLSIVNASTARRYVTVYAWGIVAPSGEDRSELTIQLNNLRHLALVLGPFREPASDVESASKK